MKTIKVRPILVETKDNEDRAYPCILKHSIVSNGKIGYYDSNIKTPTIAMELILVSLAPEEKIEVADKLYFGNNIIIVEKIHDDAITFLNPIDGKVHTIQGINRFKKIIATQDQISPEDIQKAIEQYNASGKFEDVEVAREHTTVISGGFIPTGQIGGKGLQHHNVGKIKLTNGFVTIVEQDLLVKDRGIIITQKQITYTEDEVRKMLLQCCKDITYPETYYEPCNDDEENEAEWLKRFNTWFENNRKK